MDTGKGSFVELKREKEELIAELKEAYPNHGGIFRVGEIVELKGSRFKIKSIKPTELRLKLLKRET